MGLRKKVIIGISVVLLLGVFYLIINDILRRTPENEVIPCCEQILNNQGDPSLPLAKRT